MYLYIISGINKYLSNPIWKYSELLPFLKTFLMKKLPIKVIETCCNECEYKSKDSGD